MKRIQYACLEQTIRFILKDDIPHNEAVEMTRRGSTAIKPDWSTAAQSTELLAKPPNPMVRLR